MQQHRFAVVPGVGTLDPRQWRDDTGEAWIESIPPSSAPGIAAFTFPHGLSVTDSDLWQSLSDAGDGFLKSLHWLVDHEKVCAIAFRSYHFELIRKQVKHCPLVLIGHSLGGLILKQVRHSWGARSVCCEAWVTNRGEPAGPLSSLQRAAQIPAISACIDSCGASGHPS